MGVPTPLGYVASLETVFSFAVGIIVPSPWKGDSARTLHLMQSILQKERLSKMQAYRVDSSVQRLSLD